MTRRKYLDLVTIEPADDNEEVFGEAWTLIVRWRALTLRLWTQSWSSGVTLCRSLWGNFRGGGTQGVFSASQIGYDDFTVWLSPGFPTIETRVRDPCCTGFAQEGMLAMRSLTLVLRNQYGPNRRS